MKVRYEERDGHIYGWEVDSLGVELDPYLHGVKEWVDAHGGPLWTRDAAGRIVSHAHPSPVIRLGLIQRILRALRRLFHGA